MSSNAMEEFYHFLGETPLHLIPGFLQAVPSAVPDSQWFATLGVGGGLAAFVMVIYRADRQKSEDRLLEVTRNFMTIVRDNTEAVTRLAGAIESLRR